jgi:hypothetical protein
MNGIDKNKWIEADKVEMDNMKDALGDEKSGLN